MFTVSDPDPSKNITPCSITINVKEKHTVTPTPYGGGAGSGELPNPLGVKSIEELVQKIGGVLFDLAIPIAVILIIWAGIKMIISQGNPEKVTAARKSLWYIVLGLAVLLIGQGFVSLIKSILDIKQ